MRRGSDKDWDGEQPVQQVAVLEEVAQQCRWPGLQSCGYDVGHQVVQDAVERVLDNQL